VTHQAWKTVIITEKLLVDRVAEIIEANGGTGYTYVSAGGKGSRGKRATTDRAAVVDGLSNVKIEVITPDHANAEAIAEAVAAQFFENFSGITYLEPVEILRQHKFVPA
jgi:nitrogen regulatory protein PII